MFSFLSLAHYLRPYRHGVIGCIAFNLLTVLFSTVNITMLLPFFNILFKQQKPAPAPTLALHLSASSVLEHLNYWFSELYKSNESQALLAVCLFIIISIFLKNLFRYLALAVISPVRTGIERDLRNAIFEKVLRLPLSYYSEQRKGDQSREGPQRAL